MNKLTNSSFQIAQATISINTYNCIGHPLIWPDRKELLNNFISKFHRALEQHGLELQVDIITVQPGSIRVVFNIALVVVSLAAIDYEKVLSNIESAQAFTIGQSEKLINKVNDVYILTVGSGDVQGDGQIACNVSGLVFAKSGLFYGPVKQGDSLSVIAEQLNPAGVTNNQTMMALYQYNPSAFYKENINNLKVDACFSLPKSPKYLSKIQANLAVERHNADRQ